MAEFPELDALRSVEEITARLTEVKAELTRMDADAAGRPFDDEERDKFRYLKSEADEAQSRIDELEARAQVVRDLAKSEKHVERQDWRVSVGPARGETRRGDDIYDLTTIDRSSADSEHRDLRDRAMRTIEIDSKAFVDSNAQDAAAALVERDEDGAFARRILTTGNPAYKRAFGKAIAGKPMSPEEQRTALGIGAGGGNYPVPYVVDPTVVLTSNGAINPVRQIARVIQIAGNHWTGVASSGITASYDQESTEVSDDTPSLTQPAADVEMARAFVQYSMEIDDDWGSLQSEMGRLFATAKDELESNKFLKGLGHASYQPEGLLVGANTGTLLSTNQSAIIVGDLYNMVNALSPRFRSQGVFAGALGAYQKIRQLDTAGGANLWVQLSYDQPATLIGKPAYEWSDYSFSQTGTLITGSATCLTFGDFNEFTIIDRVGMSVELVPIMLGSNRLPNGNRGLFARWRNTSDVRTASAFVHLQIKA